MQPHVGVGHARLQPLNRLRVLKVQRYAVLAMVDRTKGRAGFANEGRPTSVRVLVFGALDIQHLGAERGQGLASKGSRQVLASFYHANARQRQRKRRGGDERLAHVIGP